MKHYHGKQPCIAELCAPITQRDVEIFLSVDTPPWSPMRHERIRLYVESLQAKQKK